MPERYGAINGSITLAAGQAIRRNAADNAFEAFTPAAGGGTFSAGVSNIGNTSGNTGTVSNQLVLAGGNNITLSQSTNAGGATITVSGGGGGGAAGTNTIGMSNIGNTSGHTTPVTGSNIQFVLAGGNNITLSQSTNGSSATVTISAFNQSVESNTIGMSNLGNTSGTTGVVSGGNVQMLFAGGNNVTLSQSLNGSSGTITISAGGGGAAGSNTIGMSNIGNTSGDTKIVSGSAIQVVFAGGDNVTLSQSTSGTSATVTISARYPYQSLWFSPGGMSYGTAALGQNSIKVDPVTIPAYVTGTRAGVYLSITAQTSSNNTMQGTLTVNLALYTRTGSTLSSVSTGSQSYSYSFTSNQSTAAMASIKRMTMPMDVNITPGEYWYAIRVATSNGGTSQGTLGVSRAAAWLNSSYGGVFGSSAQSSFQALPGMGFLASTSSTMPASMAFSSINGTAAGAVAPSFIAFDQIALQ
jgi:hypothetical protein